MLLHSTVVDSFSSTSLHYSDFTAPCLFVDIVVSYWSFLTSKEGNFDRINQCRTCRNVPSCSTSNIQQGFDNRCVSTSTIEHSTVTTRSRISPGHYLLQDQFLKRTWSKDIRRG